MRALVIDDEPRIRRLLALALAGKGWETFEASDGFSGLQELMASKPDVVLLDLNLPDMDGSEVLSRIRGWSSVPVVVLSVRDAQEDIVSLLESGADDYIVKPFYTNEMLARVAAVCRRRNPPEGRVYRFGDLEIDVDRRSVARGETEVHLTSTEFAVLAILLRHAGKIVTRDRLLKEVWGPTWEAEEGSLRVHIMALRRKLESDPERPTLILTELGVGYRIRDPDETAAGR